MPVSQKGKRRVEVDGTLFLWRVVDKYDQTHFDGVQATVTNVMGNLHIEYGLNQDPETRHLWVAGDRLPCPRFESEDGVLSASGVRRMVGWYLARR